MLRVYHLLIGIILLALSPFIFNSVFKKAPPNKQSQPQPTSTSISTPTPTPTSPSSNINQSNVANVTPNNISLSNSVSTGKTLQEVVTIRQTVVGETPKPIEGNVWKNILGTTNTPPGWKVAPCKGNAPLLCISSQGKNLGSVEMEIYPIEKQPKFQKMLVAAGIFKDTKIDYQNPDFQNQIASALNAWVTDDYNVVLKERKQEYANKTTFFSYPPQRVAIGKLQGVRYGFTSLKREGGIKEQHFNYVAFDGNSLYRINTAFDPGAVTGKFEKQEHLAVFEPFLSAIAANLKLPN